MHYSAIPDFARTGLRGPCSSCGYVIASHLCDYAPPGEDACDRKLCSKCAVKVSPKIDYCPAHARLAKEAG